jgi:thioredoxin reductase (NADPH)
MIDALPNLLGYPAYALALLAVWALLGAGRWAKERRNTSLHYEASVLTPAEPPSLHPLIDPARCIGCGACTNACPEGKIIGLIGGKAQLLDPGSCIGHGACKTACPTGAISLVFGTASRGVDIPEVSPRFESNVPGLYIAGELGGMGLIANAIEQGRQAIEAIAQRDKDHPEDPNLYDAIIVGGGPAGIAATLAAKEQGLRTLTFEQDTLGGTVARFPRGKLVMTRPAKLPLYGKVKLRSVRKEKLLGLWQAVIAKTGVRIHHGIRVLGIHREPWGFEVETVTGRYGARAVLLATGRRGSPRRLGVAGEYLAKVVYSLVEPSQYRGQHVLVVGGGDSALEAAAELCRYDVASVTLCYRGKVFSRAKPASQRRIAEARLRGRLHLLYEAHVRSIEPHRVVVEKGGQLYPLQNDAVIICAGGLLPSELLSTIGVRVETKYGTA